MSRSIHMPFILLCACTFFHFTAPLAAQTPPFTITDKGNYYEVIIDYSTGTSRYEMGRMYMEKVMTAVPNIESLLDSYIAGIAQNTVLYTVVLSRVSMVYPQIPQDIRDEIDGMASMLSGTTNTMGDGVLTADEFRLLQLLPDIGRTTECSGISIFGERSATGNPMSVRILDWTDGVHHELAQLQSVTTILNGDKSICNIGYLTLMGMLTGFNDDGVFAGILDAGSGEAYDATGKRSYFIDLRYALEQYSNLTDVAAFLTDDANTYTYNHLILLSDTQEGAVLENNFSGSGSNIRRAVRWDNSDLNSGVPWGLDDAVAAVNSCMLLGNHDQYTGSASNTARWNTILTGIQSYSAPMTFENLKAVASFDNGDGPGNQWDGDLYNSYTQHIAMYQPNLPHLEVFFRPKSGILPDDPIFDTVAVYIGAGATPVESSASAMPMACALEANYPNPVQNVTVVPFTLDRASYARVSVYNMLGAEVSELRAGNMQSGRHTVQWNASELPAGMYYIRLHTEGITATRRVMVVH